jgi:hypothetical protein
VAQRRNKVQGLLRRAAERAAEENEFWASVLSEYMKANSFRMSDLQELFKCEERDLLRLHLCRLPPESHVGQFREDINNISEYTGIDSMLLVKVLREVEAYRAFWGAAHESDKLGYLKAARERKLKEKHNSDDSRNQTNNFDGEIDSE